MKVLIVEDQQQKAELLKRAIRDYGQPVDITVATNARDGFIALQGGQFNLVFLDVVLPLSYDDDATEDGSVWFLKEVHRKLAGPGFPLIVGTTQFAESKAKVEDTFRDFLWSIIYVSDSEPRWPRQVHHALRFAQSNAAKLSLSAQRAGDCDIAIVSALRIPEFNEIVEFLDGGDPVLLEETNETWLKSVITGPAGLEKTIIAACADEMGMTAMASLVTRVVISCKPKVLMLVGIMGGNTKRKVGLSDLIVIEETWDCRAGKITEEGFAPDVKSKSCDFKLANTLMSETTDNFLFTHWKHWKGDKPDRIPAILKGAVACSPAVIADDKIFEQLEDQKRKILGVEMEAYGCYDAAHKLGDLAPKVISVKSVCDLGDKAKNDHFQRYCASLSAAAAINVIKSGLI